ncbi:MAG: hypothetical protein IKP29_07655 [Pseudobutyrivibrio sp.]|nr:hypothetical protein [Pseudobutyrivibrio sp.]
MKKICPTCKRMYDELKDYCSKCGIELVKEPNRCSQNKKSLCKGNILEDDDVYCPYCGSPSIYFEDEVKERMSW